MRHELAYRGSPTTEDAVALARSRTAAIREVCGSEPDSLRITDHMTNRTTVEKLSDA
jgi:hypothetical protein